MGRDGSATRERLLDAARHLFGQHGVAAVSIREINELAGQRNASALHYHFGSRDGLVAAVVQREYAAIDARRWRLLESATTPRDLVAAVIEPLAERLSTPDGRDYLRILPEILGPGFDDAWPAPPGVVEALARLHPHLRALPRPVRESRLRSMVLLMTSLLADRAMRIDAGQRQALGHRAFVDELVTMALGLVLAGPS